MGVFAAAAWSILHDLADPFVFVPAIAVGWLARSARIAAAGAVLIAIVSIGLSVTQPLPPGADRVLWLEPVAIIALLAWSYATYRLRQWLLERDRAAPGSGLGCSTWMPPASATSRVEPDTWSCCCSCRPASSSA